MTRATRLIYQGTGDRRGDFFSGVPARDLDEADIAALNDEQYAEITGAHPTLGPLYVPEPAKPIPAKGKGD